MTPKKMILSEIAFTCPRPVGKAEKLFETQSRVVMSLTSDYFGNNIVTPGFWKLSICVNSKNEFQHMKIAMGVLRFNINVDINNFVNNTVLYKKSKYVEIVSNVLCAVFAHYKLDSSILEGLPDFINERGYNNTFLGPEAKSIDGLTYVKCDQRLDEAIISLVVIQSRKEKIAFPITVTSPEEFIFRGYLTKPEWVSSSKIKLHTNIGDSYSFDLGSDSHEIL